MKFFPFTFIKAFGYVREHLLKALKSTVDRTTLLTFVNECKYGCTKDIKLSLAFACCFVYKIVENI